MGSRTHRPLIALALAAFAQGLAAQNPPAAAPSSQPQRDTMARELILNEVYAPGPSAMPLRVTLNEGTVYRVEVQPGSADISIRSARRLTLPPLYLVPLEGGGPMGASLTSAFLFVPRATEEYRIDVTAYGGEPVQIKIWTDPREMSRWARMRRATKGLPMAGLGLRAVYFGAFVRPHAAGYISPEPPQGTASALGVEACVAVVPRGAWVTGPIGGCVLSLGTYSRPDSSGRFLLIATEPRFELSAPGAAIQTSAVLTVGVGTEISLPQQLERMDYLALGLGLDVATEIPGLGRHWWAEAEGGLARMQELGSGLEPKGQASIVPHLGLGLQLRF